jgi:hypothetical protein
MKIAVVFYGQPRDYTRGHRNLSAFMRMQTGCSFDFFYHCWTLGENETFKHSPWRDITAAEVRYDSGVTEELRALYKPLAFELENQNTVSFDQSLYQDTLAHKNISIVNNSFTANINNTLYQMHSRVKSCQVFRSYLESSGAEYDFVLTMRFDYWEYPILNVSNMDTNKVYASINALPRRFIPDNCVLCKTRVYLDWFDHRLLSRELFDDTAVDEKMHRLNEHLVLNPEQLILAKFLFHHEDTSCLSLFQTASEP